jgi:cysteine desulfurase
MADLIYLDSNATTPVAAEVLERVLTALREGWGNPSSDHAPGRRARAALEEARTQVAELIDCGAEEVVFTSGGTESDNAAVVGVAEALEGRGRHLVTSAIEHPAVEQALRYMERRGWRVTRVPVQPSGRLDPADVEAALTRETTLISIMHANNETGVLQPIRAISALAREREIPLHTDAAQSVGKLRVSVDELGVDLLTVAGHKLYAPKGVGALYIRTGTPFAGLLKGANHESGRRPGTENTPGIVGLGAACRLAAGELDARVRRMREMRDRLAGALRGAFSELVVHGASVERLPNTLFAAIPGLDAATLLARLEGVAASAGAACHSGGSAPSAVLHAMGVSDEIARATLRLSVGRNTTSGEIDTAVERIVRAAREADATMQRGSA